MKKIIGFLFIAAMACNTGHTAEECRTSAGLEGTWLPSVPMLVINGSKEMSEQQMRGCFEALLQARRNHPTTK